VLPKDAPAPIDPKALKPLMYWAGLSLQACQLFEYGVKFLLVVMAQTGFGKTSFPEAAAIIEDQDKKTVGQLLGLLKQRTTISDGWRSSLQAGLDARNEIIHRFFIERAEQIADPATRPDVLTELKRLRKTVLAGDEAVREIIETLYAYAGRDFRELVHNVHEEIRDLNDAAPPMREDFS
jgi:hypothetical protein